RREAPLVAVPTLAVSLRPLRGLRSVPSVSSPVLRGGATPSAPHRVLSGGPRASPSPNRRPPLTIEVPRPPFRAPPVPFRGPYVAPRGPRAARSRRRPAATGPRVRRAACVSRPFRGRTHRRLPSASLPAP